jgi:hypothetical protein
MDSKLLRDYLRFLHERSEALLAKEEIERFDIAALQRELRDFQARLEHGANPRSPVAESAAALVLKATESDLDGDAAGALKMFFSLIVRRYWIGEVSRRQQARVKRKIGDFRNEVSHLIFALDV